MYPTIAHPPNWRSSFAASFLILLLALMPSILSAKAATPKKPDQATEEKAPGPKNPIVDDYAGYVPTFIHEIKAGQGRGGCFGGWIRSAETMKLSAEKAYFTLTRVDEDERANALVKAGVEKEKSGQHRDALKVYQTVIEKYGNLMYRVSPYGVFAPISEYCQRRILNFPKEDLAYYRTVHDARAREAYEQARRQYSLSGFSEVVERYMATSYGDNALFELGNASLDSGHFLAALERFTTLRDFFPDSECRTAELDLKIQYCRRMLGIKKQDPNGTSHGKAGLSDEALARLKKVVASAHHEPPAFHSQFSSAPHVAVDDYTLHPPTQDPLGLKEPAWKHPLPGAGRDRLVYAQPVVAENSVIFRYKNRIYCHSILNGKLRWSNEIGGRATWQNARFYQHPHERVLVQDGIVFTPIHKIGPSMAALDASTGALKWAYGPIAASSKDEARMRFLAVPAGGPRTVFAVYVLDNIEGETHSDTEYGVMAFESATGRVKWRRSICRLQPGKFAGGFARFMRNRIRSFSSPPLYHQGTLYVNTNAGALAALDALSGRVKWLIRYPYWGGIHDATRPAPKRGGWRSLFFNQPPLLIGEKIYFIPVDTRFMFCVDRGSGKVLWSKSQIGTGFTYMLGAIKTGEILLVNSGNGSYWGGQHTVRLVDPNTGKTVWRVGDLRPPEKSPVMTLKPSTGKRTHWVRMRERYAQLAARPFITTDGKLYTHVWSDASAWYMPAMHQYVLTEVSLADRKILQRRRFLTGQVMSWCGTLISMSKNLVPEFEKLPRKNKKVLQDLKELKLVAADSEPVNLHGPFRPYSRLTFKRYGVFFELRFGTRQVEMVFDRDEVLKALGDRKDPEADFARAELAIAAQRFDEAAERFKRCLRTMSSEDLDFRARVNQQLFRVHRHLARNAIRAGDVAKEYENALGMSRTAGTAAEEIETLFALAEAYERKGDFSAAARCLRSVIATYGAQEYPIAPIAMDDYKDLNDATQDVLDRYRGMVKKTPWKDAINRGMRLLSKGLPLYQSTVSPLDKDLTLRAGELAARRLIRLSKLNGDFRKRFATQSKTALEKRPAEEQEHRIWEFPGTPAAQNVLDERFEAAVKEGSELGRRKMRTLADAARVCGLSVPRKLRDSVVAPQKKAKPVDLAMPLEFREHAFVDSDDTRRIVLQRKGNREIQPDLLFLGARVRKRLDNKFIVSCLDLRDGKMKWETKNIRLRGTGQEPGFFEAFVYQDRVIVHGLYDVLAFRLSDGKELWRFRTPFDFEIRHALLNGDVMVLAGDAETLALHIPTDSPTGELAWQVKEQGEPYVEPFFRGDRLISVRKMPFSVTVRYRVSGKLIGRLDLPDLLLEDQHPLLKNGPRELPCARDGSLLFLTDSWYYLAIDMDSLQIVWKRIIDKNDPTRRPKMRFAAGSGYLAVVKNEYDQQAIYMLESQTGRVLWNTDPANSRSARPMHSMFIEGDTLYGLGIHPAQGFYVVTRELKTGKRLINQRIDGYDTKPIVRLFPAKYGNYLVARVRCNLDFEIKVFDLKKKGKLVLTRKQKGAGEFGVPGRASATVQAGRAVLLTVKKMGY